jgi:hypothetical protein
LRSAAAATSWQRAKRRLSARCAGLRRGSMRECACGLPLQIRLVLGFEPSRFNADLPSSRIADVQDRLRRCRAAAG